MCSVSRDVKIPGVVKMIDYNFFSYGAGLVLLGYCVGISVGFIRGVFAAAGGER